MFKKPPSEHDRRMQALADAQWKAANPSYESLMPQVAQMIQSKYIGVGDVPRPVIVTVRAVTLEKLRRDSTDQAWIMWFNELPKGLRLNNTILKYLEKTIGGNSDGWIGKRVKLYVDETVEFGGRAVGGVRIQAPRAAAAASQALYQSAPAGARFDPMTGQPIARPAPSGARFDPMTGRPLNEGPATTTDPVFDQETGEVLGTGSGAPVGEPDLDDDIPF